MTRLIARAVAVTALVLAVVSLVLSAAAPAMAAKEKFQRSKPHVNVGSIGHTEKPKALKQAERRQFVPAWGTLAPHGFDDPRLELPRDIPAAPTY